MNRTVLEPQAQRFNGQVLDGAGQRPIEQRVERQRAALDGALDPLSAPWQMHDVGQSNASEAALTVDELPVKRMMTTMPTKQVVPTGRGRELGG